MWSPCESLKLAAIIRGVHPDASWNITHIVSLAVKSFSLFLAPFLNDKNAIQKKLHRTWTSGSNFLSVTNNPIIGKWLYATAQWIGSRSSSSRKAASFGFAYTIQYRVSDKTLQYMFPCLTNTIYARLPIFFFFFFFFGILTLKSDSAVSGRKLVDQKGKACRIIRQTYSCLLCKPRARQILLDGLHPWLSYFNNWIHSFVVSCVYAAGAPRIWSITVGSFCCNVIVLS